MVTMYGFTVREPKSIKSRKISSYYPLKYEFSGTRLIDKLSSHKVQLLNCLCTTVAYKAGFKHYPTFAVTFSLLQGRYTGRILLAFIIIFL